MASKKVQATIEEQLLAEMEERMAKEKFYETSEFVKHCIRYYLIKAAGGLKQTILEIPHSVESQGEATG